MQWFILKAGGGLAESGNDAIPQVCISLALEHHYLSHSSNCQRFLLQCFPAVRRKPWALVKPRSSGYCPWEQGACQRQCQAGMMPLLFRTKARRRRDTNPSWEWDGKVCHALTILVPEVTGNEKSSFIALSTQWWKSTSLPETIEHGTDTETFFVQ